MITIVESNWEYIGDPQFDGMAQQLEKCGRTCYKSEGRITDDSADKFIRMICRNNHVSVLEHCNVSVRIICSRACSHQLVRHRLAAYSQESQRYCNYGKKDSLQVICPPSVGLRPGDYYRTVDPGYCIYNGRELEINTIQTFWLHAIDNSYDRYSLLIKSGLKPEDARFVLPNACKTELAVTMNLRMWRHVFKERALNSHAQWEIKGIFKSIYDDFNKSLPSVFGDLT